MARHAISAGKEYSMLHAPYTMLHAPRSMLHGQVPFNKFVATGGQAMTVARCKLTRMSGHKVRTYQDA